MADQSGAVIRCATSSDLPRLEELLGAMHAQSPRYSGMTYSGDKTLTTLASFIENPLIVVLVAEKLGVIVGLLAGFSAPQFFGPDLYAGDIALYVVPEAAGKGAGDKLLSVFEIWAGERGAGAVSTTAWSHVNTTSGQGQNIYERNGYQRTGYTMQKSLLSSEGVVT